jgi:hypothetical protein
MDCCDDCHAPDPHRGNAAYRRVLWAILGVSNLAVLLAAAGVFGMGTGWPDVIVAVIMASLALQGAKHPDQIGPWVDREQVAP